MNNMSKIEFISTMAGYATRVFEEPDGVNPSVVIAQAILESGCGTSELAKHNNFFGLNNYNDGYLVNAGTVVKKVPQEHQGKVTYNFEEMASFNSVEDCFKSLKKWYTRPHYIQNLEAAGNDSFKQIEAIKKSGYSTSSQYVAAITRIIKENKLLRYDKCYSVQCGAFHNKSNAKNLKTILNGKFNKNIFALDYDGKLYYVRAFKSHDMKKIREWISVNIAVLPLGSFVKEV